MPQGKGRRSSPGVGPGVGSTVPLWASELSPEGAASRSQGHLPKGWPIQKTAAKSVQVGTRRQSPPGALRGGTDGAGLLPHTCMLTASFIQQTHGQARAGGRHTGSLPLQRPGWVRSRAQLGARLKLSLLGCTGLARLLGSRPREPGRDPTPTPECPQPDPAAWPECERGLCGLQGGQISAELQPQPSPGPPCSPETRPSPPPSRPQGGRPGELPAGGPGGKGPRSSPAGCCLAGTGHSRGGRGTPPAPRPCSRPHPAGRGPRGGTAGSGSTAGGMGGRHT